MKYRYTYKNAGGIVLGLIMEVEWNSTFFVGCEYIRTCFYWSTEISLRFCLEKLGVLSAEDHPALVLRVFWKYAPH